MVHVTYADKGFGSTAQLAQALTVRKHVNVLEILTEY